MKRYSTLLFSAEFSLTEEQGLENRKLKKLLGKGRRRNMSRKEFLKNHKGCKGLKLSQKLFECKSRSCFYRLFMFDKKNHWKSYNLEKIMSRVTSLDLLFKTCHW